MPYADGTHDHVRHILPEESREEDEGLGRDGRESAERYFSVRWMLERERAREESDDCSSAFAIIPVVGVCLMVLYVIWLDQASHGLAVWLASGSPLAKFMPFKFLGDLVVGAEDLTIPGAYA